MATESDLAYKVFAAEKKHKLRLKIGSGDAGFLVQEV